MRIVLAFDKFKGTLTAAAACAAAGRGLRRALPDAELVMHPVADGGDGTLDALAASIEAERRHALVCDAIRSRQVRAPFLLAGTTAFIEMAAASGLAQLDETQRDPLGASTFGTGELMRAALDAGATRLVVGLGGSATNDGGIGIAQAFGYRFLDRTGAPLPATPRHLARVRRIVPPAQRPSCEVIALADVDNPLLGPRGATSVYGPQKGVTPADAPAMEAALRHLADLVHRDLGCDFRDAPGAGAAGGCAFGLMSFLGAAIEPGFDYLSRLSRLEPLIATADAVVVGEGRMDGQTMSGKAPAGVAALAARHHRPIAAIAGTIDAAARATLRRTFAPLLALTDDATAEEALRRPEALLEDKAEALGMRLAENAASPRPRARQSRDR